MTLRAQEYHLGTSIQVNIKKVIIATLLLEEWEDNSHTIKMGTWEFAETPKTSKFNFRGQNTLHWGVFYIIEKLSKCKCQKWFYMSRLDICSTSYDKKKVGTQTDSLTLNY
jgi:hypothetical protein